MPSNEIAWLLRLIDEWRARAEAVQRARLATDPRERDREPVGSASPARRTILVVDDEDDARSLMREVLDAAGYAVLEARDGSEALLVADWHAGPIDLVVTDVVMPYLDGKEFGDRLRALRADTKVLFVSGYASDRLVGAGRPGESVAFLPKPFSPDQLEREVRRLLGEAPPGVP